MNFEWDEATAFANQTKHSVSLKDTHFVVSFAKRSDIIRIISARHMTRQARKAYER